MRPQMLFVTLLTAFLAAQTIVAAQAEDTLIRASVRRVLAPSLFTLEYEPGVDGELVVLAHDIEATPVPGTTILVSGLLRMVGEGELKTAPGWDQIDLRTRDSMAGRPILVALSVRTAAGRQLMAAIATGRSARQLANQDSPATRAPMEARLHPGAFAELIDEVGGRQVQLPRAKVLVVLNPQAFLIESASTLSPFVGNLDRVLVLVDAPSGALRVDPALLVGSNVTVRGMARTLLGMQVSGEVPWPPILTRQVTDRFEIKAVVLASSVQTADGVELTTRK
jgi:hypothetical protein